LQHYRRYYGRKSSGLLSFLKILAILVLVLLLLLLLSTLFLQRYLVYGDDGIRLDLPWNQQEEETPPPPSVSVSPPPIIKEETPAEPAPSPELPDPISPLHAVHLNTDALLNGTVGAALEAANADCAVFTMKEDSGYLNYVSAADLAVYVGASAADLAINDAIRELTAGDTYTVAQVSCFRDHRLSSIVSQHKLSTASGYCWEDADSLRWISPADPEVVSYLTALCVELAELGFDEILLTHCGYPTAAQGNLDRIREDEAYPRGMLDQVIGPFLSGIKTALEPYEVKLSVRAQTVELKGESADTGLTMANVLTSCDRIWVAQEEWDACALSVLAADPDLDPDRMVVRVQSEPGEENTSWAILN